MDSENSISNNENTNQKMYHKAIFIAHLMKNLIINKYGKENPINHDNREKMNWKTLNEETHEVENIEIETNTLEGIDEVEILKMKLKLLEKIIYE